MDSLEALKAQFHEAMFVIYQRAKKEANYPATIFYKMVSDKGGLATAKTLINAPKPSDGYTALWERGRLDLTVEAEVIENERWHQLFLPEELDRAKKRLVAYHYDFKGGAPSN
jgi:hypothetical protein